LIELKEVYKMETTMHTMNPDTAMSRAEAAPAETAPERRADVVSRGEFRLLLWMGAFALTAILGGMTVLYTGITDLRVAMEAQRAELLTAMEAQRSELLTAMEAQRSELLTAMEAQRADILDVVRSEIGGLRAEIGGEIGGLRAEIGGEIGGLRAEIADLRERVARIETRLDTIIPPPI